MSNIPNIITSARLLAAIVLLTVTLSLPDQGLAWFIPLFVVGGISDLLDGYIARRFNCCTEFGARLDSISDLSIYSATIYFLWVHAKEGLLSNAGLLVLSIFLQAVHIGFAIFKHGHYPSYHTNFSRFIAYVLFFGVLTFWFTRESIVNEVLIGCWIATIVEGITITCILNRSANDLADIRAAVRANQKFLEIQPNSIDCRPEHVTQVLACHGVLDQTQTR